MGHYIHGLEFCILYDLSEIIIVAAIFRLSLKTMCNTLILVYLYLSKKMKKNIVRKEKKINDIPCCG